MRKRAQSILVLMLISVISAGCGGNAVTRPTEVSGSGRSAPTENERQEAPAEAASTDSGPENTEVAAAEYAEVEAVQEDAAQIPAEVAFTEAENIYARVLDFYYYGIRDKWKNYIEEEDPEYEMGRVSFMFNSPYTVVTSLSDAGYMQTDIDGDGIDELIVTPMSVASIGLIYDLYSYQNGHLMHVAYSGERFAYSLCENRSIVFYGSNGAASSINTRFSLRNGEMFIEEQLYSDYLRDEEKPWFYGKAEDYDQKVLKEYDVDAFRQISEEEAEEIMASWPQKVELSLTSFADYTPQSSFPIYSMLADPKDADIYTLTEQELAITQALHDKITDRLENDDLNQTELNQLNSDLYDIWDKELNTIWKRLKGILSAEDMAALTQEEREWIQNKEYEMKNAGSEYEGGSMQPMIIYGTGSRITRERVYELVERYLTRP